MARNPSHGRRLFAAVLFAAIAIALGSCERQRVVQGECRPMNGADVCVWGETSGNSLVAFGATVPLAAIENAPAEVPMSWPPRVDAAIPLPGAVRSATGFSVARIYWQPHGHPPGPFMVPHFGIHFYTLTNDVAASIDCTDSTKPASLPAAFELPDVSVPKMGTLIGMCVPGMGMHAMPSADLHGSSPLEHTVAIGYYHGTPVFVAPMLTRAALLERRGFSIAVPDVPGRPSNVRYPTQFRADFDSTAQAYKFTFSGLTPAGAP